jgi:hypothetical protein
LLDLLLDPEDGGDMFLRYVVLAYTGLHSNISQKIEFFITTTLRVSNPVLNT